MPLAVRLFANTLARSSHVVRFFKHACGIAVSQSISHNAGRNSRKSRSPVLPAKQLSQWSCRFVPSSLKNQNAGANQYDCHRFKRERLRHAAVTSDTKNYRKIGQSAGY
jgi:hypothetical protein